MSEDQTLRMEVPKTIKLFIKGQFPRTESGRTYKMYVHKSKKVYANICLGSRKDLRGAVEAAKSAFAGWSEKTAFNRSQILYRMAEMTEGKRREFQEAIVKTLGRTEQEAELEVSNAIDAFIFYAGFADKYQAITGTINPVSGPYHNFTAPEPMGVVGVVADDQNFNFARFISDLSAAMCSGNTVVALMGLRGAACLAPLAEVLATSDLPPAVCNLISGDLNELLPYLAAHMEVNAVVLEDAQAKTVGAVKAEAIENMKRVVVSDNVQPSLKQIVQLTEAKTVWHPIGF